MQDAEVSPDGQIVAGLSDQGPLEERSRGSNAPIGKFDASPSTSAKIDFIHFRWLPDSRRVVVSSRGDQAPWYWDPG